MCNNGMDGRCEVTGNRSFVHFIRHPADVLVSGYLYHRDCKEQADETPKLIEDEGGGRSWLFVRDAATIDSMRRMLGAAPDDERSYCEMLRSSNASVRKRVRRPTTA